MLGTKILEERKSKFNGNLRVVRTWGMGTYIQSDGLTQSGGIVEDIWKQTLKKVNAKKLNAKSVLILGLGGGTVAKLIHNNYPKAEITGVDIDPAIIELGRKYLKLDDSNVKIIVSDASNIPNHLEDPERRRRTNLLKFFDLIIVDLYQGDKFPKKFETDKFLKTVRCHLAINGLVIFNRLYYKDKKIEAEKFGKKLKTVFKKVDFYRPPANLMYICYNI